MVEDIDSECFEPTNFPYCSNGVYDSDSTDPPNPNPCDTDCTVFCDSFLKASYGLCEEPSTLPADLDDVELKWPKGMDMQ